MWVTRQYSWRENEEGGGGGGRWGGSGVGDEGEGERERESYREVYGGSRMGVEKEGGDGWRDRGGGKEGVGGRGVEGGMRREGGVEGGGWSEGGWWVEGGKRRDGWVEGGGWWWGWVGGWRWGWVERGEGVSRWGGWRRWVEVGARRSLGRDVDEEVATPFLPQWQLEGCGTRLHIQLCLGLGVF